MEVFVEIDLQSKLEFEDGWNLVCHSVVVLVQVLVVLAGMEKRVFSCWLENDSESEVGISSVEVIGDGDLAFISGMISVVALAEDERAY